MNTLRKKCSNTFLILVTLIVFVSLACGGVDTPQPPPTPNRNEEPSQPSLDIRDTGAGLEVTNNSSEVLTIRASYVVPNEEPGFVGVCNPYGPPGNRSVPLPEEPFTEYDQVLPPNQRITIPSTSCPVYTGYSIWARNVDRALVFQFHK